MLMPMFGKVLGSRVQERAGVPSSSLTTDDTIFKWTQVEMRSISSTAEATSRAKPARGIMIVELPHKHIGTGYDIRDIPSHSVGH